MARTRKCKCKHSWNEHDALTDGFGRTLIVCMAVNHESDGEWSLCSCKAWDPDDGAGVQLIGTSTPPAPASATTETATD